MKSALVRVLLAAFLIVTVAGAWYKPLDGVATEQIDAGLKRSLVSFATARGLNGVISLIQGTQVSIQPFGIGTTLSVGQILHPVNELTSQFAELMLGASIAFVAMKVLIGIGSYWLISLSMSACALVWGWFRWHGRRAPALVERMLFALLIVRFAMPLVAVGSDAVFQRFMHADYVESQNAIEGNRNALSTLAPAIDDSNPGTGVVEQLKAWWSKVNLGESLARFKLAAGQVTEHIIKLMVVFLMQTLVIPLLLFWALYKAGGALFRSPIRAV